MAPSRIQLAVIIPARDEAASIATAVTRALREADEVIVSDGGSRDGTRRIAEQAGARVLSSPPGRGPQLDRGARASQADALLFLHADTVLPEGAGTLVRQAIAGGAAGGGFTLAWDAAGPLFRIGERWINLRTRWTQAPLGDQAQFAARAAYEAVGGFPHWPILEDLWFIRRLRLEGRLVVLESPVLTSARRFLHLGVPRTLAINWTIFALYWLGVPPHRLARLYGVAATRSAPRPAR